MGALMACLTGCLSIPPALRFTVAPMAERGALTHVIGRTKGGRNTKLHAVCDGKGRPLVLLLRPGNVHDCRPARPCLEAMPPAGELVADKGYDSKEPRKWLQEHATSVVIPPRKNRKLQYDYEKAVYKQRNIIEHMFCRLKDWRHIATWFDRKVKNFMAAVALAAAIIWWL
ncbi:MAG: IS5 family transposase [Hyphomicrobiales bacterium]